MATITITYYELDRYLVQVYYSFLLPRTLQSHPSLFSDKKGFKRRFNLFIIVVQEPSSSYSNLPTLFQILSRYLPYLPMHMPSYCPTPNRYLHRTYIQQKCKVIVFFVAGTGGEWKGKMSPSTVEEFDQWTKRNTEDIGIDPWA